MVTAVRIAITLLNINIPNDITKLKDLKPAKCSRPFSYHHCKAVQALPSHPRLHQGWSKKKKKIIRSNHSTSLCYIVQSKKPATIRTLTETYNFFIPS